MITIEWIELKSTDGGVLTRSVETLELPSDSLVSVAMMRLGYSTQQLEALFLKRAVAIFGVYATAQTVLHAGDRLEILDTLNFNPMESRRRRIVHKETITGKKPPRKSQKRVKIDQHSDA